MPLLQRGYVLLGLLIESISGMTYRDYVRTHIFTRGGDDRLRFLSDGSRQPQRRRRMRSDPRMRPGPSWRWKKNIYSFPPIGSPDSGAHVTVADLDRFLRAVRAGELLSPELTSAFLTPQVVHSNERDLDGDVRVRVVVLRRRAWQGRLLRKGGDERWRQRHDLAIIRSRTSRSRSYRIWKMACGTRSDKIHELVVDSQAT